MKLKVFLPTMLVAALSVQAQTNENATPQAEAQTHAAADEAAVSLPAKPVKSMSLQDCIQQALEHNLGLEIARYDPEIKMFDVSASYASGGTLGSGYDPTFTASGTHAYSESGGSYNSSIATVVPGSVSKDDILSGDIGGLLPWGMNYDFFIQNLDHNYGSGSTVIGTNLVPVNFETTRGRAGVSVTQPLLRNLWSDGTRLGINIAKNRFKYSEAGLRFTLMDTITQVENAYYDLIAAQEKVKVQEKSVQLAEQLLSENKKRVEVGALAPLDEKQAESQVATARADLLTAKQTLASQQNTLKSLLTDNYRNSYETDIQPAETLSAPVAILNVMDSWSKAMTMRPDLIQARLDAEQQGIQLKYDRNQMYPQLDVYGSYGYNAGGASTVDWSDGIDDFRRTDMPFYSYGVKFSIPLSNKKARNDVKSSKLTLKQRILTLKQTEQTILTEVDNDVISARAGYERVAATRDARIYAEAALDAEQKKLENGKSTSFQVLSLQKDLTTARSAEITALSDYNKALATLSKDEGSTLERRKVDLTVK